ncbi:MAG: hypothetical protein JXR94_08705, partial [Candidatus Hydrogenedentes bacterium]|nr:hypothetical protein [Candidatus Hydrogenedentota bacterium]
ADSRNPLLLGDYLNVEILGRYVENVFVIPRATLRDGSNIWLVDADSRLVIQPVEPVWGDDARVLVRGIEPGAGLIVSDLPTPVAGMELRRASDASELGADESEPAAGPEDSSEEGAQ